MLSSSTNLSRFYRSLWQILIVFIVFSITFVLYVRSEKAIDRANELRLKSHMLTDELRQTSDDLTRMARSYVVTGNPIHKRHFQEVLDIRNGKSPRPIDYHNIYWDLVGPDDRRPRPYSHQSISLLELMRQAGFTEIELAKLAESKRHSDALTRIEYEAMALSQSNPDKAAQLLQNDTFYHAKAAIMKPISDAHNRIDQRTVNAVKKTESTSRALRILFVVFGMVLLFMLWRAYRALYLTLGASLNQLHSHIALIGSGDFTSEIPVAAELKNSILGWLSETQVKLFKIDTERKDAEKQLIKLLQAIEQSSNTIIITDYKANIEYVNEAFFKTTGYTQAEVIGQNPRFLQSGKTPRGAYDTMWAHITKGETWHGEFNNRRKDGTEYIYSINISPVFDTDNRITHYIAIEEDITEKKQTEEHVHYLANFDPLTGLPNRRQLNNRFHYILASVKRNRRSFAVMFLDLDHFKEINDSLGHSFGDMLLIQLAQRLKSILREEDTLARLGGDEFIVLLPDIDVSGAAKVAEKLMENISQPFTVEKNELTVTASIGMALYPADGLDMETLSKNADAAMYRAKEEGRNTYSFFTEEMQTVSTRNLQLSNALYHALARNELYIVYQPQIFLKTGHIIGAEALIRWQHPEFGTVSPAEFIPIAENNGLILSIGEWVLRSATAQLKNWLDSGLSPIIIAVNLSAIQFRHPNLPNLVTQILDETGLPPEYLELELTEGVAMHNPQAAISIMNNLHKRGIRMSIDDFGTGYSSLSYLKQFKIYKLKIDQSFIRDISIDTGDRAIVDAIIHMAHSLGLQTIAEGVETVEQLDYLRNQGCDEIQGYYYSRPLPSEQFESLCRSEDYLEPDIWVPSI